MRILTSITLFAVLAANTMSQNNEAMGAESAPITVPNWTLQWTQQVNEIKSTARYYTHNKSGAPLLYLSNEDDNKVFCIAFHTPPADSTGSAHIMEHSALCGSKKFPSKEPFVDLLKGSLQTFLNAFTSDDRTMYPVASKNDKDFGNLMDVYLDAVFFPKVVEDPFILMQEGWHYEIDEKTDALTYNGIVYNEMKGVYSSPNSVLNRTIQKAMYPDSTYVNDSGGNPDDIPNLTQDKFAAFHKKYYQPSNSMIYLYGNGNVKEHLEFLDKEYLSKFDKSDVDAKVKPQLLFTETKDITAEYSVDAGESTAEKTYLSMNYLLPTDIDNVERAYGLDLLTYILVDSEAGQLRRALLDAGIGLDVDASFDTSILQPCFSIVVQNSEPEKKDQFIEVLNTTLKKLVKEGIDRKIIEGAINRTEFSLREFQVSSFPKGLAVAMQILESWSYGGDPLKHLRFEPVLKSIREKTPQGFFEKLVQTELLDNPSKGFVMLKPKAGLEKEQADKLAAKLADIKNKLTPQQLEDIKKETAILKERQAAPDKPEDVAKIPQLAISDVNKKTETYPFEVRKESSIEIVHTAVDTNKIVYVSVSFDLVPWQYQPAVLTFLADVLGRLDTAHYTYSDLNNEIDIHTGGIGTGAGTSPVYKNNPDERFTLQIGAKVKTTQPNLSKGLELVHEILTQTKYTDKARLKEIVSEQRSNMMQSLISNGRTYAQSRAASYFSALSKYNEATGGLDYYKFLVDLEKNWDTRADEFVQQLQECAANLFSQENMRFSVTVDKELYGEVEAALKKFAGKFPEEEQDIFISAKHGVPQQLNEAIVIPSKVQYVVKSADYKKAGFEYSGKMLVLQNVLRTGYLWNNIRVLGGAYGGGMSIGRTGTFALWSYRDPHLKRTVDIYDGVADYLEHLEMSDAELTKAVIATIGSLDKPLTPSEKGAFVNGLLQTGLTFDDEQKERDEVLTTTVEDLRGFAKMFREGMKQNNICVFGGEEKINEDKSLFKTTLRPIE